MWDLPSGGLIDCLVVGSSNDFDDSTARFRYAPVMNLQDIRTLLDFHYWARDRILDAVEPLTPEQDTSDLGSSFASVRNTLVHLYSAECNWYSRWQGVSPTSMLPPEQFPDVASLRAAWQDLEGKMRAFLEELGEEGVGRVLEYKMMDGRAGSSAFSQMFQHVVNHGTYHRGQVTTLLRQLGALARQKCRSDRVLPRAAVPLALPRARPYTAGEAGAGQVYYLFVFRHADPLSHERSHRKGVSDGKRDNQANPAGQGVRLYSRFERPGIFLPSQFSAGELRRSVRRSEGQLRRRAVSKGPRAGNVQAE